jgi:RNA-binding protein
VAAFAGLAVVPNTTDANTGVREMADIPAHIMRQAKSHDFRASVRIGKSGLTETVLDEIRQQLQSRDLVKVKVNKGLFEREQRSEVWQYVAEQTASHLVLQRGNIGVLWRR